MITPCITPDGLQAEDTSHDRSWLGRLYIDAVFSTACFALLSLSVGQIWRSSFDDELDAIELIVRFSPLEMFKEVWGYLVHPPTFYAIFAAVYDLIPSLVALRLFALACSGLSIFLFHQMFLNTKEELTTADRLVAVLGFSTVPLLLRLGDSIRWYPLFTLLFALLAVTVARRPNAIWPIGGLLGALSFVNIQGFLLAAAVILYRYVVEQRQIARDLKFIVVAGCIQILPLPYYYAIFREAPLAAEQTHGYLAKGLQSYYELVVGFFGGFSLGIGLMWVLVPILGVAAWTTWQLISRFRGTDRTDRFLILVLGLTAAWATLWTNAYSFIYAALCITYLILKVMSRSNSFTVKAAVMSTLLLTNGAVIGNLQGGKHPFFRSFPAPSREMATAISRNFAPGDLVVITDPNLPAVLDAGVDCVQYFNEVLRSGAGCPLPRRREGGAIDPTKIPCWRAGGTHCPEQMPVLESQPRRVLILSGRDELVELFDRSEPVPWQDVVKNLTAGRRLVASIPYRYDADASLKSRLTGKRLDPFVFWIQIFE